LPRTKSVLVEKYSGLDFGIAVVEDTIRNGELSDQDEAITRNEMDDPDIRRKMRTSPIDGPRLVAGFAPALPEFQHR